LNRVFVLGSGFSALAGAPLSRSVLSKIFGRPEKPGITELKSYLGSFLFRGQEDWISNTNLEEVLSRLDLIRHYRPYSNVDYSEVSFYEEQLLSEFTGLLSPGRIKPGHRAYLDFISFIKASDAIISFNYDLIIESLLTLTGRKYDYLLREEKKETSSESVKILKLHGSINAFFCHICGEIFIFSHGITGHPANGPESADSAPKKQLTCARCLLSGRQVPLKHFIIAPTLFKSYTLPSLRNLWFRALEILTGAREIYFIGYSLPEADILSYQLFDFGGRMAEPGQDIYLIDGPRPAAERFKQIYGNRLINLGIYFEEWME